MEEIWRPVKRLNNLYEVSNLGNVRSISRTCIDSKGRKQHIQGKILAKDLGIYKQYYYVRIHVKGVFNGRIMIHKLVAETFIPNPNNLPCINHKNENKLDNRVENLEWCDHKYNTNYGTCIQRRSFNSRNQEWRSCKILQLDLNGNVLAEYPSFKEAQRQIGHSYSNIWQACNKKVKTAYGYKWKYKND